MFRHDFVGGYFALLDANQNPLPVSCTKLFMPYFMFVLLVEGLLVVSTVQEVGWNQSCVRKGQFGIWTIPQSLCPLC